MYDPEYDDANRAFLPQTNNKPAANPKRAGAPNDGGAAEAGAAAGGTSGMGMGALWAVALIAVCLGAAGAITGGISLGNDDSLRDALRNNIQPVLEYVYSYTNASVVTSQSFCTASFTHVAYGDASTGNVTLGLRRGLDAKRARGAQRGPSGKPILSTKFAGDARGFPVDATVLPGVNGVVSILRAGHTVHIVVAATGYPESLADPIPSWDFPATVRSLASYLPYECIPPIANWPNCNDTIDNVATCEALADDYEHSVFLGPFGREAIVESRHTFISNGVAWFLEPETVAITTGYVANAYAGATTDGEYLVGVQSYIDSSVGDFATDVNIELYFDQIHAQFQYRTDASVNWEVPEDCIAACL